ncbi:hypothetical protein L13192_06179 [Pyrenophora tritici-repentis]|nr:hypothetical protein L13192_06179 [Pyrenophora tritici-repentis]
MLQRCRSSRRSRKLLPVCRQPFVIILCLYNSMTAIDPVVQSAIFRAATPVMAAIRQADNWIAPGAYERGS